jgi:hypothetical protein
MEEARHLSFARAVFPEVWEQASWFDRNLVRQVAPIMIRFMFDSMVHPGVYKTVGLPALKTWRAANRTAARRRLRFDSTRPILKVMVDAGALRADNLPLAWRKLAGKTRGGDPTVIAG